MCLDGGEGEGRGGLKSWLKTSTLKNRGNEINIPPANGKTSGDSVERKCCKRLSEMGEMRKVSESEVK